MLTDSAFTREEKRRVLESRALDSQLTSVADQEYLTDAERPDLREAKLALLELERES